MTVESEKSPEDVLVESVELASETMARLYETQGFFVEAERARKRLFAEGLWKLLDEVVPGLEENGLSVEKAGSRLVCRWRISEELVVALKTRLPTELIDARGLDLALRIASLQGPRKTFWDMHPAAFFGGCVLEPLAPIDSVVVALGLRAGTGRFLPAFHEEPIRFKEV